MMKWLLEKMIGTHNQRECKRLWPRVEAINALEPEMQKLSDEALRAKTDAFRSLLKERLAAHKFVTPADAEWYERNHDERAVLKKQRRKIQQEALDEILPQAFAVVREAARRTLNMRHFDVQLLGGMVLHEGKIAEMSTGEGKTLVATLAAYLNALTGRGVHIVTVNDYLARRDARWMGPIYHALGLSVGVIQGADPAERRREESLSFIYDPSVTQGNDRFTHLRASSRQEAYLTDITYGQNNEFGFDYLRDNMRFRREDLTQGEFHFAIVDEVDSILIDEARTPLIISGPAEESTDLYFKIDRVVRRLNKEAHYEVEEKDHAVSLNEEGIKKCEELLGIENLYDESQMRLLHHINQALRAHELYKCDVDYMVKDNEIIIVDEFTGRLMPGRRWSDGLHQAIEAKENVQIRQENQTLATVTFQNYFRMYEKLSGMTGTASTEAQEFKAIYDLDVVTIPTNRPMIRFNAPDVVFKTEEEKFIAVVQEIAELHRKGQPILIGTISIEKSEHLSRMLKESGPFLKRLATIARMAQDELKKEAEVKEELRKRLEQALTRPAMLSPEQLEPLAAELKRDLPKSILVFRFEDLLRFAHVVEMVKQGIRHNVLNAKYHEQEAKIIAQAGRKAALTIATNMAGRGTDILLGGNPQALAEDFIREEETKKEATLSEEEKKPVFERFKKQCEIEHDEVVALGGLHVLGTERHEARRIDNQLRGRCGRQGDPGSSRFYLSLADDLMRIFNADRIARLMEFKWFQWEEGMPIEHSMVTGAIETAQRRVEGQNFDTRKQLLEYDNTMNRQREVIYEQRRRILDGVDLQGLIRDVIAEVADELVDSFAAKELRPDAWDLEGLRHAASRQFGISVPEEAMRGERDAIADNIIELFENAYEEKRKQIGQELMAHLERTVMLSIIDAKWKDHLYMMDSLREGIHLRAYGQRDPVVEYQREAYQMFQEMTAAVKVETLTMLLRVQPAATAAPVSIFARTPQQELHPEASSELAQRMSPPMQQPASEMSPDEPLAPGEQAPSAPGTTVKHEGPKVGRNDPCPCGSGQKYKKCHGK